METVTRNQVEEARVDVQRLHLLCGLWRARNAADALNERAMRHVLEILIALATEDPKTEAKAA